MSVYMNNAATSYPKSPVARASFVECLDACPIDLRNGSGQRGGIGRYRTTVAAYVGAQDSEVYFLSDATLALNCVLQGWRRENPGGAVFFDNRSHNAVNRTVEGAIGGVVINLYDAQEDVVSMALADIPQSRCLVCLSLASNVNGAIYDVGELVDRIKRSRPNTTILVDASQAAGSCMFELSSSADYVVFPGHKFLYATLGTAALVARRPLVSVIFGGTGDLPASSRDAFVEVGTPNIPSIASLAAAITETRALGTLAYSHALELRRRLQEGLAGVAGLEEVGTGRRPTTSVISYRCHSLSAAELGAALALHGICVRSGLHCNPIHHASLGMTGDGTLRFSPGRYNTPEDIDEAVETIEELSSAFSDTFA